MYSEDDDLLAEAVRCQRENQSFNGVIYGHQTRTTIGQIVGDLEFLLTAGEAEDFVNQIFYLPLQ